MDASPVPLRMRQALYLTYDKNRHAYNEALRYSLLCVLFLILIHQIVILKHKRIFRSITI